MILPARKPRLIGFDLDGTLLDSLHGLRPEVADALQALRASGIELAFLTGRRPRTCRIGLGGGTVLPLYEPPENHDEHEAVPKDSQQIAAAHPRAANDYPQLAAGASLKQFSDPAHIATNSGCLLWDFPAWTRLDRRLLPAELVGELVEMLAPWSVNLYQDASADETGVLQVKRIHTPEMELCTRRFGYHRHVATDPAAIDHGNVTQLSMPAPPELVLELRDKVRERFGSRLFAIAVKWPLIPCLALEVFAAEANKGSAMDFFAQRLGIPRELTMAVGDDTNDLPMFDWCGFSAAMPQSPPEIAASASVQLAFDRGADEPPPLVLARYLEAVAKLSD